MYSSRTVTIAIARPLQRVYEFLAEPRNLPRWASGPLANYRQVGAHEWEADGPVRVRFTPVNRFGIVDFSITPSTMFSQMTPARVYTNGEGAELAITLFQLDGISDEQFASDCAWLEADLQVLKTYLESLEP